MKLASVQIITDIQPIPDADNIVTASILGWQVVIKKGEYNIGDNVCYIQIDTIVPELPEYEFLRDRKFRVTSIKLRKQISQGLIVPLPKGNWKEGDDLTNIMNIKKYEKVNNNPERYEKPRIPKKWYKKWIYLFKYNILYKLFPKLQRLNRSPFPKNLVSITDEERIQNIPQVLTQYAGKSFIVSYKLDGCLEENTRLKTPKGEFSIKELFNTNYTGKVLSKNLENYKDEFVKINKWLVQENLNNWYKITLENGVEIIVTENHPFWLENKGCYRECKDLTIEDKVLFLDIN